MKTPLPAIILAAITTIAAAATTQEPFEPSGYSETTGNNTGNNNNENNDNNSDNTRHLPVVSVTAAKNPLLTTLNPAATILGPATIAGQRIDNLRDLSELAPNLYIPTYGSRITASIYLRGIGARIDQPAVGLLIDNIPILNKDNYDIDIDNLDRIAILRGPQSTMYGRNTMAGIISLTTLSPARYQGVRASVTAGNYGHWRANAALYHRLSDHLAIAAGAAATNHDGYYRNQATGRRTGTEHLHTAWYTIHWQPLHNLTVTNTGRAGHTRQQGYPYRNLETSTIAYDDTCSYRRFNYIDGLTARWQQGPWQLTSTTSVQHIDDDLHLDQDFTTHPYFTLQQRRRETTLTQEITLQHTSQHYQWILGAFAHTRHSSMRAPVTFLSYGISRLIEQNRNEANPQYPIRWDEDHFIIHSSFSQPTRSIALYHQSTLNLGRWTLNASLRLDIENPQLRYRSTVNTHYNIYDNTGPTPVLYDHRTVNLDEQGHLSRTYLQLIPALTARYQAPNTLQSTLSATISRGYKAGGFNTQMFSDFLQQQLMATMGVTPLYDISQMTTYRPETCWNFELGTTQQLNPLHLTAEATIYYIDIRDQQLTRFPPGLITGRIMTNAGHSRSIGAEITLRYNPHPRWNLTAAWGHNDTRFITYNDGHSNYHGRHIPYIPLNTLNATLTYRRPLPRNPLRLTHCILQASTQAAGPIYWNEDNTLSQPLYATLSLQATAATEHLTLQLWARNITATHYDTFYFQSIGNRFMQQGTPFTIGATLTLNLPTQ